MSSDVGGGFWDFFGNFKRIGRAPADPNRGAPQPVGGAVADLVDALHVRHLKRWELARLRKAGPAVVPPLVAALADPFFISRQFDGLGQPDPVEVAMDLLRPFAPPELAAALRAVSGHPSQGFRKKAYYNLGRSGADEAIEALLAGLRDPDEEVRQYALMGLGFLGDSSRGSPAFRDTLLDAVVPLLDDPEWQVSNQAAQALLALDRERGADVLLSPSVLRAGSESLPYALDALRYYQVPVPAAKLRPLLTELKPLAGQYPYSRSYGYALILLARSGGAAAADVIDDALTWAADSLAEDAAEATQTAAGAGNAREVVWTRYGKRGMAGLTEPQLNWLTLFCLDAEVGNGGFAQFFLNSTGELARFAVRAAEAAGATRAGPIIAEAVGLFGPDGPSPKQGRRDRQLSRIPGERLAALDLAYYTCGNKLRVLMALYAARHAEQFR